MEKQKGTTVLLWKGVLPFSQVERDSKEHRCLSSSLPTYKEAQVPIKASPYLLSLCLYARVIEKMSSEGQKIEALIRALTREAHWGLWALGSC